jgi:hypothetical protein
MVVMVPTPPRSLVAGLALVAMLVACGADGGETRAESPDAGTRSRDDTTTTTETTTTTTTEPTETTGGGGGDVATSLTVEVTDAGQAPRTATLTCNGTATGTGFLAEPAAAEAACTLLQGNPDASQRLIAGRNPDLLCTEIFGGPEVARVSGEIDGQRVETTVDRTDGCGIADWDMLGPLFGVAY